MERDEHEERHDKMEQYLIRMEGKLDLLNSQIEHQSGQFMERFANSDAATGINQKILSDTQARIRTLEDWRRDVKAYGRVALATATAVGSVAGSLITVIILRALGVKV